MSTQSINRVFEINSKPECQIAQDNYLANYVDDQKKRDANDVIWVCTAMSIFGMFFFGLPFQIASLLTLISCLFRRRKPTRGGAFTGVIVAVLNMFMISSSLYLFMY